MLCYRIISNGSVLTYLETSEVCVKDKNMMDFIKQMSKEDLLKLVEVYAKNWLAHDGCWFLAAEEIFNLETAIDLDEKSWFRFASAEAKRIIKTFEIPKNGGLESLAKAFNYRLYSAINKHKIERPAENKLIFTMTNCKVQETRRRKGLADFPCKSVGIIEFSRFAEAVDSRIKTSCIHCPPDETGEEFCKWEFIIESR